MIKLIVSIFIVLSLGSITLADDSDAKNEKLSKIADCNGNGGLIAAIAVKTNNFKGLLRNCTADVKSKNLDAASQNICLSECIGQNLGLIAEDGEVAADNISNYLSTIIENPQFLEQIQLVAFQCVAQYSDIIEANECSVKFAKVIKCINRSYVLACKRLNELI